MEYAVDSHEFEYSGHKFRVTAYHDDCMGAPWEEHDGHGIISDWTTRDKAPGELVLASDRGSNRYYDFAETVKIARRDGWGFLSGELEIFQNESGQWIARVAATYRKPAQFESVADDINDAIRAVYAKHKATFPSARAYAAGAAMADYESMRKWCNNDWCWIYIRVELLDDDGDPVGDISETLGGIESYGDYWKTDAACELADQLIASLENVFAD